MKGKLTLLRGLALVREPNFTSPLHDNLQSLLAGLDLLRIYSFIFPSPPRKARPSECVYMENFQPSLARPRLVNSKMSLRRAGLPLM